MSTARTVTLAPITRHDTWDGLHLAYSSNGTAFASPLALVRMQFRDADGALGLSLTSSGPAATITISDAARWAFSVLPITSVTLAAGTWTWSIETTAADGRCKTYLAGTIKVVEDATI